MVEDEVKIGKDGKRGENKRKVADIRLCFRVFEGDNAQESNLTLSKNCLIVILSLFIHGL